MPDIYAAVERSTIHDDFVSILMVERQHSAGPAFTTTARIWRKTHVVPGHVRKSLGTKPDTPGISLDELAVMFPTLKPVFRMHLSDTDGRPIRVAMNGWFAYTQPQGHQRAARVLRIQPGELPENLSHTQFCDFVESLAPRYAADAEHARAVMDRVGKASATMRAQGVHIAVRPIELNTKRNVHA